ncbi:MAG: putative capsular polysaccharide synthesis family protein [Elainellaceae cyanobacterium]
MPVLIQSALTTSRSFIENRSFQRKLPILFGILAIALNNFAVIAGDLNWIFSTTGTIFLLLAAKTYTANRANDLSEITQNNTESLDKLRQQIATLQQKTTRKFKRRIRSDRQLKKRVRRVSSRVRKTSEIAKQAEFQRKGIQDKLVRVQDSLEIIRSQSQKNLDQPSQGIQVANLALAKVHSAEAKIKESTSMLQALKHSLGYAHWCYYLCISLLWQDTYQIPQPNSTDGDRPSKLLPQVSSSNVKSLLLAHDQMTGKPFYRSLDDEKELILVHQMGKVGSTSIYDSLKARSEFSSRVFHTHVLNPAGVPRGLSHLIKPERIQLHKNHFLDSLYLWNILSNPDRSSKSSEKRWKIITLVREPIARNISAYFQNIRLEIAFPKSIEQGEIDEKELDQAIEDFKALENHKSSLLWMDRQVKEVFGIDVYQEDFDHHRGYNLIRKDNVNLLVIKLEELKNNYKQAFRDLLGFEDFQLKTSNVSDSKEYASIYEAFKDRIVFSQEYIELIYTSKLATHFYTPQEIEKFIAKWTKNTL